MLCNKVQCVNVIGICTCGAMRSNAEQCGAMRSNAEQGAVASNLLSFLQGNGIS